MPLGHSFEGGAEEEGIGAVIDGTGVTGTGGGIEAVPVGMGAAGADASGIDSRVGAGSGVTLNSSPVAQADNVIAAPAARS